jgi:glycosyltransferase-like protein
VTALRIALLTYSTKPRGGVVHTLALAEALATAGHDVSVWTLGRDGDLGFFRPVHPAVRLHVIPFPPDPDPDEAVGPRILRSIAVLGEAFRTGEDQRRADVVHAQDCISANAVLPVRPDLIRTVHHIDQFSTPELAACHERALTAPRRHVCVSVAVAAELARGWSLASTVIPNGVDAGRFAAAASMVDAEAAAAREGWRRRFGCYVLAVGGIEPRKGTLELVEAMALLGARRGGGAPELVVAGGETLFDYRGYREQVLARAQELGVRPQLLGTVPHDELPSLVAGAGVLAFPSTKEGFGLAAMEALAAGVPLVTRDLPVLREVYAGTASFASTPDGFAEAMDAALDEADARRVERGRRLAAAHTWSNCAAAHLDLYRSALSDRPPAGR